MGLRESPQPGSAWLFFAGNHGSTLGIGDWVRSFSEILGVHELTLHVSGRLDASRPTLVLEEFSAASSREALRRHADRTSQRLVLLLSEFMTLDSHGHLVLNPFEQWTRTLRPSIQLLRHPKATVRSEVGRTMYMARRAAGLEMVLKTVQFDAIVCGHPEISGQLTEVLANWGVPCPKILDVYHPVLAEHIWQPRRLRPVGDGLIEDAALFADDLPGRTKGPYWRFGAPVVIQGFDTPYRRRLRRLIARGSQLTIQAQQMGNLAVDEHSGASPYWGFDPVIPRSADWPFSSPFRMLRAHRMGLIPVSMSSWWPGDKSIWASFALKVEAPFHESIGALAADLLTGGEMLAVGFRRQSEAMKAESEGAVARWSEFLSAPAPSGVSVK